MRDVKDMTTFELKALRLRIDAELIRRRVWGCEYDGPRRWRKEPMPPFVPIDMRDPA